MSGKGQTQETEQLRARIAELEEQQRLQQTVVESMGDGLIAVDELGMVTLFNPAARTLLGPDFLLTDVAEWTDLYRFFAEDGSLPLKPGQFPLVRALQGEAVTREAVLMHRSPSTPDKPLWLSIAAHPIRDEHGVLRGAFMILRDIGVQKEVQAEIELHERAMESSSEGISITDPNLPGNPLVYVNKGFERLTGYSREEVLGTNCRFLQGPQTDSRVTKAIGEALREERPCTVEVLNYRKDGTSFWNRLSLAPVRDASDKLKQFVGIQSDITERVKAEKKLQETSWELEAANQHLMQNLDAAAKVQAALLPAAHPEMPGVEFAWRFLPCEHLAGDILNVMRLDEHHVAMYVLDVTGHGTAAALLSVAVSRFLQPTLSAVSIVKKRLSDEGDYVIASPAEVADELNRAFPWSSEAGQFFTIAYGVLNVKTREFRFVCAGHPGLIHVPQDSPPTLRQATGMPIGLSKQRYEEALIQLEPGDRLFFYSDGVTETMNPSRQLFGEEQLIQTLGKSRTGSVEDTLTCVLYELQQWRESVPLRDDVTLLGCAIPDDAEGRSGTSEESISSARL